MDRLLPSEVELVAGGTNTPGREWAAGITIALRVPPFRLRPLLGRGSFRSAQSEQAALAPGGWGPALAVTDTPQ